MGLGESVLDTVVHPRMLQTLEDFYPSEVTIQAKTTLGRKPNGEEVIAWADVSGLTGLRGNLADPGRTVYERRSTDLTRTTQAPGLNLAGYYPEITVLHRAIVDGTAWNITAVHHDSLGSVTRLELERVTT
jgi:hypothetical protein